MNSLMKTSYIINVKTHQINFKSPQIFYLQFIKILPKYYLLFELIKFQNIFFKYILNIIVDLNSQTFISALVNFPSIGFSIQYTFAFFRYSFYFVGSTF